jgi:hypothetical protein
MTAALAQAGGYVDDLISGEIFQALIGPFVDTLGIPLVALMFFGAIGTAYYAVSGRSTMPVIMIILIGGVTLGFAPPSTARFGIIVLVLGLTSIGYLAYRRARGGP